MGYNLIDGKSVATAEQMRAYIKQKNKNVSQKILDAIPLYLSVGASEGIRGDIAFAQSCIETGNFMFIPSQTAVSEAQNNFCGMGVIRYGVKGNAFKTPLEGVTAQIQHLKAYANSKPLNLPCVDPRFNLVSRGSAKYVEWLGINENPKKCGWAGGVNYGGKIMRVLNAILDIDVSENKEIYRVRKQWTDSKSQCGAFENIDNAKKCCDENKNTFVFNSNGICIYPVPFMVEFVNEFNYYKETDCKTKAGKASKGKYTIISVDVVNNSGKLKSGAGFVKIDSLLVYPYIEEKKSNNENKTDNKPKEKSLIEKTLESGIKLYDDIVSVGCEHKGGECTVDGILKNRKTTCTGTLSAILADVGIIKKGESISHTSAVGSSANNIIKKKNTIQKAMTGYENINKNKCKVIYLGCLNFSKVPDKYKIPGAMFIQDSNGFMYQGKNKNGQTIIRSCNNDRNKQLKKDKKGVYRYYNNTMTSGYPFNSPVLVAIIPNS